MEFTLRDAIEAIDEYLQEAAIDSMRFLNHYDMKKNNDVDKSVRKIDIYRNQLKRNKISKEEFDRKVNPIVNKYKNDESKKELVTNKGSSEYNHPGARSNKKKFSGFNQVSSTYGISYEPRPSIKNSEEDVAKIDHLVKSAANTDNYGEYKSYQKTLRKFLGHGKDNDTVIRVENQDKKKGLPYRFIPATNKGDKDSADANKDFYHTTKSDNVKSLKPSWKSTDGVLYPEKRIYFNSGNKEGSRYGRSGNTENDHVYKYTGNKRKDANIDPELAYRYDGKIHGDARYIKTDKELKVSKEK